MAGEDLYNAARSGDIYRVNRLIRGNADLNWENMVVLYTHTVLFMQITHLLEEYLSLLIISFHLNTL